jgi:type VI secretion system protein
MNLTLEVISANGSNLGGGRRKVFGEAGGRIGRSADCDWVLPSPDKYVSRHHASILFKIGQFFVKAEGENAVAINDPNALLASNTPSPLKQGDRVFIDDYEILASLANEATRAPLIIGDPFADEPREAPLIPADFSLDDENLDPLSGLPSAPSRSGSGGGYRGAPVGDVLGEPAPAVPMPRAAPAVPRSSSPPLAARTPQPPPARASAGGMAIPTDPNAWDRDGTTFGINPVPASPPAAPIQAAPQVKAAPRETVRQQPRVAPVVPASVPPSAPPRSMAPPVPHPAAPAARSPNPPPRPGATGPVSPQTSPASPAPPRSQESRSAMPVAGPTPKDAEFDVDAMLAAAGVDPRNVSAEMAATLGQILMVVVQGTIDTLRARDEVKSQFRLAVTRVRAAENNPLTFAVDAADAMNSLLSRRNAAFLAPLEAFQRAFDDIRSHQMAMLAGMRAGFENLMDRFDPEQLQEGFDKQAKRSGLLGGVVKPRYWDQYADYFAALRGDRDDAFRRLFGEEFALAYDKQIELIKRSRGKKNA